MEEPAFLMAVQRIVGGVEVEDDLLRSLGMRVEEEIDEQALDSRCRVLFPARAAQSVRRRAVSFPARVARTGS